MKSSGGSVAGLKIALGSNFVSRRLNTCSMKLQAQKPEMRSMAHACCFLLHQTHALCRRLHCADACTVQTPDDSNSFIQTPDDSNSM